MYKLICPKAYFSIFSAAKTLNVFILELHFENDVQDFLGTTWPILFKFTGHLQNLQLKFIVKNYRVKKYYLVSQESFYEKKIVLLFTNKLMKNGPNF